ncbi:MAG: helix-turn-helix domain-containing protein [Alistipes sp.]|nr:helix-turn-helix domain-containing protein [Alistipes sp.]
MTQSLAAEYLSVGKSTIYRYIKNGQINILKLPTKTLTREVFPYFHSL